MAKKTFVQVIDDIDGTVLDNGKGETVKFGLDGKSYSIDLTEKNAKALRAALQKYIDNGTKAAAPGRAARTSKASGSGRSASELTAIREWAPNNGYAVAARGRISSEVLRAYDAAHGK